MRWQKKSFTTKIEIDIFLILRTMDVSERIGEKKNLMTQFCMHASNDPLTK